MNRWVRGAYAAAGTAAELASRLAPARESGSTGKITRALALRRGAAGRLERWGEVHRDPDRPLVWMHAASVGEGLMALAIAERLRADAPGIQLAYTYFSPSAERFAASLGADVAGPLPFDTPRAARRMLDALSPTALVFVKGDVWPVLAEESARRRVRTALVNAVVPRGSGRSGRAARLLLGDAYAALDAVGAVSTDDAARLAAAGAAPARILVTGDARYDQAWGRVYERARHAALVDRMTSTPRPTIVAGSTWPADERHLIPAFAALRESVPGARLVLAPHEPRPDHLEMIERLVSGGGVRVARIGDADAPAADVVLVDRMGVLAELYACGDVAYVGGGFHRAGLHSVVEPAVLGVPVVVGPRHHASRDSELLLEAGAAVAADGTGALSRTLATLFASGARRAAMAAAARAVVSAERGAAARNAALVRELLGAV